MSSATKDDITRLALEQPASIRRQLPSLDEQGWILPEFIVGSENAPLRHLFSDDQLDKLHDQSPIILYGEKLVGKTALAITLAVNWSRSTNLRPLCFATGRSFATEYASAVEIDDITSFRKRFRKCKLLVIDDIDPLAEKPAAQQELAATLDALAEKNAPVIFTASILPASMPGIDSYLGSRLSCGLSIGVQRPSPATRAALLDSLASEVDKNLPTEGLARFCEGLSIQLNASDLKSIVTIAQQNYSGDGVDFGIVSQLAKQLLNGDALTISGIAKSVAKNMRVKLTDMRGSTRQANIVRARGLAILLSRRLTPFSLQQIGEFFGGRDHSTVLHACRKTEGLVESDPELSKALANVQNDLLK